MITRRKLLTGAAVMPVASVPLVTRDAEEEEIVRLWRAMPDGMRAIVHNVLRSFNRLPSDPELKVRGNRYLYGTDHDPYA